MSDRQRQIELDVCIESVLTSQRYDERIRAVAGAGYPSVEFWFHDGTFDGETIDTAQPKSPETLKALCQELNVSINNMVVNAPDGSLGGSPVDSRDHPKYLERLEEVIDFAKRSGIDKAITCSGNCVDGLSLSQMHDNLVSALSQAAGVASKHSFTLLLEPLNTHVDHPGYFVDGSEMGASIVREVNSPHLRLLYDVYHMQIMEGNILAHIERNMDVVGHFHSAGVPGRAELDSGELDYRNIVSRISEMGYAGRFGLEYFPAMSDNLASLKRLRDHLNV